MYLKMSNTCFGNNTVFNDEYVRDVGSGITCFRRGSMSTSVNLKNKTGGNVSCNEGTVRCMPGGGSLTIYTQAGFQRNGMYTCCIDGLCISMRILQSEKYNELLDSGELLEFIAYH